MNTQLIETINSLKIALPTLSEEKIAELALQSLTSSSTSIKEMTVSELLKQLRHRTMKKELARPRAKVKADGTMRKKDTTTYRTYDTTWVRLEKAFGEKLVSELTEENVMDIALEAQKSAVEKLNEKNLKRVSKGFVAKIGSGAVGYNRALSALSVFFTYAIKKEAITKNPMDDVEFLAEPEAKKGKLTAEEVEQIFNIALNTGNDPKLDHLILWTLIETAARIGGVLKLQLQDIDLQNQTIALYEKRGKVRQQPVTKELAQALCDFAILRGASNPQDNIFRYSLTSKLAGREITSRRIDGLWLRIRKELPWVEEREVASHVLRHTTLTLVDRHTSPTVARKFAGHGKKNVTETYTEADIDEVAEAHQLIFGRVHPLAVKSRNYSV